MGEELDDGGRLRRVGAPQIATASFRRLCIAFSNSKFPPRVRPQAVYVHYGYASRNPLQVCTPEEKARFAYVASQL